MYVVYLPRITRRTTMIGQRGGLNVFSLDSSSLLHQFLHRLGKTLAGEDHESAAAEIMVALGGCGAMSIACSPFSLFIDENSCISQP